MIPKGPATKVYLALGTTDLRKGFEGLSDPLRHQLKEDPLSGHLFALSSPSWKLAAVWTSDSANTCAKSFLNSVPGPSPEWLNSLPPYGKLLVISDTHSAYLPGLATIVGVPQTDTKEWRDMFFAPDPPVHPSCEISVIYPQ